MKRDFTITPDNLIPWELSLRIIGELEALNAACPLAKFTFERKPPNTLPPKYEYEFVTTDNRKWHQDIVMNPTDNPSMTFDEIEGAWRMTEFPDHRPLRDTMIECARNYVALEKIKCDF